MPSTVTVQNTVNYALTHTKLSPLVGIGGFQNEPALTIANNVLQEILSPPFPWKFNRKELQMFVTSQFQQDYLFAGASAFVNPATGVASGAAIDLATNNAITQSGFTTTVNTLETHSFAVGNTVFMFGNTLAAYNSSFTASANTFAWSGGWVITAVTSKSFTFTHTSSGLGTSGAPGITDMGWLESVTFRQISTLVSPQPIQEGQAVKMIDPTNQIGNPENVCWLSDLGNGVIKLRLRPVPGTFPWGVQIVYQAKAPRLTALTNTWAPLPDELSNVFTQGFLAQAYRYVDATRAEIEDQKFQRAIGKALDIKDAGTDGYGSYPSIPIMIG